MDGLKYSWSQSHLKSNTNIPKLASMLYHENMLASYVFTGEMEQQGLSLILHNSFKSLRLKNVNLDRST